MKYKIIEVVEVRREYVIDGETPNDAYEQLYRGDIDPIDVTEEHNEVEIFDDKGTKVYV